MWHVEPQIAMSKENLCMPLYTQNIKMSTTGERQWITHKDKPIRITANSSTQTRKAMRAQVKCFKAPSKKKLKNKKKFQPRLINAKSSSKINGEIRSFYDKALQKNWWLPNQHFGKFPQDNLQKIMKPPMPKNLMDWLHHEGWMFKAEGRQKEISNRKVRQLQE